MTGRAPVGRTSAARERLVQSASELFYTKGIRAVGVDEVLAAADVTRATLYRHFSGKDELVATYLRTAHRAMREQFDSAVASEPAATRQVLAVASLVADQVRSPGFRGCAFLNAAVEFPDEQSPAHQAVLEQRSWLLETMTTLVARAGAPEPAAAAQHFVMLRDGAMASGCLGQPEAVASVFYRGIDRMVTVMGLPASP